MSISSGRAFLNRRLELIEAGMSDEMVDAGYNDDALLVSFDGQVRGKEALKAHFRKHLPEMGGIKLMAIDRYAETDDSVFVQVTIMSGTYGEATSCEAFVLRDGKADYHFTVVK